MTTPSAAGGVDEQLLTQLLQGETEATAAGGEKQLADGAELEVAGPDGAVQRVWPLARHYRIEQPADGPPTLWLRPIVAGGRDRAGRPVFSLSDCRSRGLTYRRAHTDRGRLVLELGSGQLATVRPAGPDAGEQLAAWDAFVLARLPADIEAQLEELADDSWHGPFA